jgi:iron transport multicopper oxidase
MKVLDREFMLPYGPQGNEPIPDSMLVNETMGSKWSVKPNTTYLVRPINIGSFVSQYFYIEDHNFTIVEVDGVYTEPTTTDMLYIAVGQRYSVLLTTKDSTDQNYAVVNIFDSTQLATIPSTLALNQTNWLQYNLSAPFPNATITVESSSDLLALDDFTLVPYDHHPLLEPSSHVRVELASATLENGVNYVFFNNITYMAPLVPTLYTVLSAGDMASNGSIYGQFTNSVVLKKNDVVQLVVNNEHGSTHPLHLHGHDFQVVARSPAYNVSIPFNPCSCTPMPESPMRRDTVVINPHGYLVLRFVANNPGVWFFHCHNDWHLMQGMAMTFVEAPDELQKYMTIPQSQLGICQTSLIPTTGNAAGNLDFSNLITEADM